VEEDGFREDGSINYKSYEFTASRFKEDSGVAKRMRRMEERKKGTIQMIEARMPSRQATDLDQICNYNKYIMQHLTSLTSFYGADWVRIARFNNYIGRSRTFDMLAKELIEMETPKGSKKTVRSVKAHQNYKRKMRAQRAEERDESGLIQRVVISWGSAKVGSMAFIRSKLKISHKRLLERVQQMPNVLVVMEDEFNTSKVCHSCDQKTIDEVECIKRLSKAEIAKTQGPLSIETHKPWALRQCYSTACNLGMVNRDFNAAINMLRICKGRLAGKLSGSSCLSRPPGLSRPTTAKSSPQPEMGIGESYNTCSSC
jgi:hypothetical protein